MSKLVFLTVVLLLLSPVSQSQSVQDYDAHLAKLQKSVPEWRAQINAIDPAKIDVHYDIGKLIERNKRVLLQNLDSISLLAGLIPRKRELGAEIHLYGLVNQAHIAMDVLSELLMEEVSGDQKTAQLWAKQLRAIRVDSLGEEERYQIEALTEFADELTRRCDTSPSQRKN